MISVSQATATINQQLFKSAVEQVGIDLSIGRVLAAEVHADRDLPPFNRVTMDGIAIRYGAYADGLREFLIAGTQAAGEPAKTLHASSDAIEVMTGAMLPTGADTVIRYEDVIVKNGRVSIQTDDVRFQQSLHRQGQDARKGDCVLSPGVRISAAEVALFASVGLSRVPVFAFPPVAIVSTGNELVDIDATPLPWQVRKSNASALSAALREMHIGSVLFHLNDNEKELEAALTKILTQHPIVILSGGVSKGKFDFVPVVLSKLGVQKQFHQVSQRPGKPFWFGRSETNTVFALPGNPVSTYMCFYRYIKPWLQRSVGIEPPPHQAALAQDFSFEPPLTYFLQVSVRNDHGRLMATPDAGGGSGDFANLKEVDGFLELPADRNEFKKGEVLPYVPFR